MDVVIMVPPVRREITVAVNERAMYPRPVERDIVMPGRK